MYKFFILSACLALSMAAIEYRRPVVIRRPVEHKTQLEESAEVSRPIDVTKPIVEVMRRPNPAKPHLPTEEELEQNMNAKYEFTQDIEDDIHDLSNHRTEVRDGLKVMGAYSYSDGFFRRTVHYEADENGYRVTKTEEEPLEGPIEHLEGGEAVVSSHAHGADFAYRIKSVPHDDEFVIEEV